MTASDIAGKRRDSGPFHVARKKSMEAWAYNESASTITIYVHDKDKRTTLTIPVRKEVLRRLALLR